MDFKFLIRLASSTRGLLPVPSRPHFRRKVAATLAPPPPAPPPHSLHPRTCCSASSIPEAPFAGRAAPPPRSPPPSSLAVLLRLLDPRRHARSAPGRATVPPRSLLPRSLAVVRAAWRLQERIAVPTVPLLCRAVLRRGACWPSSRGNCRAASQCRSVLAPTVLSLPPVHICFPCLPIPTNWSSTV